MNHAGCRVEDVLPGELRGDDILAPSSTPNNGLDDIRYPPCPAANYYGKYVVYSRD